ncbi:BON domain-containing protein, partial [Bradyrhizobium sp. NBAIM08]|uniref:BON domain-containing protein n=1 Tax=Bradyrhizobium sp. NBAIM08 TaxID=2793815 RepID=UPI001CD6DDEB|nr:BON domain-containing protein [Bradyrhizobium sp. NBAIM08]
MPSCCPSLADRLERLPHAAVLLALAATVAPATAQELPPTPAPTEQSTQSSPGAIAARTDARSDVDIGGRIRSIFSEVAGLRNVAVHVSAGVVTLTGTVPTREDIDRASAIAGRVAGVVTVQNDIERDLKVDTNLNPVLDRFGGDLKA